MEHQRSFSLKQSLKKISQANSTSELKGIQNYMRDWLDWLYGKHALSSKEYTEYKIVLEKSINQKHKELLSNREMKGMNSTEIYSRQAIIIASFSLVLSIFFTFFLGILWYQQSISSTMTANRLSDHRFIPFQGVLKAPDGTPVDTKRDVYFSLYYDQAGGEPVYNGACLGENGIIPDHTGAFSVVIGSDCDMSPVPQELFVQGPLYLGVQVGSEDELTPRYPISDVGYARNTAQLAGKAAGTKESNIPFIDSNATIRLDADSPTLAATSGTLSISAPLLILATTTDKTGSILLQPAAGADTIIASGNLGIGTFLPQTALSVVGAEPGTAVSSFMNLYAEDDESTSVLDLGLGTATSANQPAFIRFYGESTKNEQGEIVGSIRINNGGVSYETGGADIAEYFSVPSTDGLVPGIILGLSEDGIRASKQDDTIIGVVTDRAGFVGNKAGEKRENQLLVGLLGQINVYVSTLNGPITMGSAVATSQIPGFGVKAGVSSQKGGYALHGMDYYKDTNFTNDQCPVQYRQLQDPFGKPIRCGRLLLLIR